LIACDYETVHYISISLHLGGCSYRINYPREFLNHHHPDQLFI